MGIWIWPRQVLEGKKEANLEDLELLMKYYNVGRRDAKDYYDILSKDEMKTIRKKYQTGVLSKRNRKKS